MDRKHVAAISDLSNKHGESWEQANFLVYQSTGQLSRLWDQHKEYKEQQVIAAANQAAKAAEPLPFNPDTSAQSYSGLPLRLGPQTRLTFCNPSKSLDWPAPHSINITGIVDATKRMYDLYHELQPGASQEQLDCTQYQFNQEVWQAMKMPGCASSL